MLLPEGSLVSFLVALSFAVGLNLYATIALLGLLGHFHYVVLPSGIGALASPWVIAVALCLFALEFVADKIPVLDVFWSAAHTFIRIPAAALLAFRASHGLSPELQLLVTLIAGAVAGIAHGSKTAVRTAATASPEPVTNVALSSAEDLGALALTWMATRHPRVAGVVAAIAVLLSILAIRWTIKALRRGLRSLRAKTQSFLERSRQYRRTI